VGRGPDRGLAPVSASILPVAGS